MFSPKNVKKKKKKKKKLFFDLYPFSQKIHPQFGFTLLTSLLLIIFFTKSSLVKNQFTNLVSQYEMSLIGTIFCWFSNYI
jgi:hypothetical protein